MLTLATLQLSLSTSARVAEVAVNVIGELVVQLLCHLRQIFPFTNGMQTVQH